jgi:hypothetical protein
MDFAEMTDEQLAAEINRLDRERLTIRDTMKTIQAELTLRADQKKLGGMSPERLARAAQSIKPQGIESAGAVGTPGA